MLEQIRDENQSERNRTVGMLHKWLESGTASWSILVNTLRSPSIDDHHLADDIARLHPNLVPVAPMEQNMQERSPNTDGALECDISDSVIQQTNKHNEETGELNPPIVLTHGPSDLSSLLLKLSLIHISEPTRPY